MQELIIILLIALIVFGPGKIPEIGSAIGRTFRKFKKSMAEPGRNPEQLEIKR